MTLSLAEQERPAAVPAGEPDWNESYLLAAHDVGNGIGFWMHLGRWRRKLEYWREIFTVALPDGTILAHRGISDVLAHAAGPGATNYAIRVEEPGRRLRYSYRGGAHRVAAVDLERDLLVNGPMVPVEMDLVFEGISPVWDLGKVHAKQDFLGSGHIEQIGRVTGELRAGRETWTIDAMGIRDKSMGPRRPRNLMRHHWVQGLFDNGIGFMLFDTEEGEKGFSEAVVLDDGRLFDATVEISFRIERVEQQRDPVELVLSYERGRLHVTSQAITNSWCISVTTPIDVYIGVRSSEAPARAVLEQSATWLLDGAVKGVGCIERMVPGVIFEETE